MVQGSPINDIMQMRQQGLSNNQVIQNLQREGYSNTQIFDAMNQADTKMAVEGMQPVAMNQNISTNQPSAQQNQDLFTSPPQEPMPQNAQQQPMQQNMNSGASSMVNDQIQMEELVEAIIEEKWEELLKDVSKIVDWKNKVESRVSEIEVKLDNLKENFSDLQRAIIGKVNDYDKHIIDVGSEIKAMEKVFSKVLPVFAENVNELSRISNKLKGDDDYDETKSTGSS